MAASATNNFSASNANIDIQIHMYFPRYQNEAKRRRPAIHVFETQASRNEIPAQAPAA